MFSSSPARLLASSALLAFGLGGVAVADEYKIDPDHSNALFKAGHLGFSYVYGTFADTNGTMSVDFTDATKDTFDVTITTASLSTHQEKRDQHLRSPDFFDASQFPHLTFKSTSVKAATGKNLEVTGDLTIHGITKSVTVLVDEVGDGKDPWGGYRLGYETHFDIKRSDFGMTTVPTTVVPDVIGIIVAVEGIRAK
jgi:polyisoprenoid-binding protein YceI